MKPTRQTSSSAMTRPRLRPAAPRSGCGSVGRRRSRLPTSRYGRTRPGVGDTRGRGGGGLLPSRGISFHDEVEHAVLVDLGRGAGVHDAALGQDEDAVGQAEHLVDLATTTTATPWAVRSATMP